MDRVHPKKDSRPTPKPTQGDLDWMIRNVILPYQKAKKEKHDPCATTASIPNA